MSNETTLILKTADLSLFQSLGNAQKRRSCLILYSGSETGKRYVLDSHAMTIGRLPSTEVYIDHPSVSRRHAELAVSDELVTIRDVGSSNGTHVNDRRIDGVVALKDGDLIRMGKVFLKFYERESVDALLHDRIYRMATIDEGTGIFNRQYLMDMLKNEIRLARTGARPLSVIYYDLDHFKSVNDNFGHGAGDLVLRDSAALVKSLLRAEDIVARLGGEEFIVVLPNTPLAEAAALAERIRAAVEAHPFALEVETRSGRRSLVHRQTISLGVTQLAEGMREPREVLDAADRQLYQSKHTGRNKVSA